MPATSLSSVKIRSVDVATVTDALKKWAEKVRSNNSDIKAVGYFGSYAKKTFAPGSDLDVIIVLEKSPFRRFFDRVPDLYPESFPVGVDIFAYTVEEVKKMKSRKNSWIGHTLDETIWIFPLPAGLLILERGLSPPAVAGNGSYRTGKKCFFMHSGQMPCVNSVSEWFKI